MHAEDLVIDERSDRHAVKEILELLPYADRIATLALVVEAVDAINLAALVVTSQEEEVFLELGFVSEEQDDGLK